MQKNMMLILLIILAAGIIGIFYYLGNTPAVSSGKNGQMTAAPAAVAVNPPETANASLADGRYAIQSDLSTLRWSAKKVLIKKEHTGTVKIKNGEFEIKNGDFIAGNAVMDMNTINDEDLSGNPMKDGLEKHLRSDAFFNVEKFPEATIKLTSAQKNSDGHYTIKADLTIKDKTNPVEFAATVSSDNNTVKIAAQFSIDRSLWDVRFGSKKFFDNLGDNLIDDNINFNLDITAAK